MKYPRYGWFLISIIVGQTHDIFQPLPRLRLVAARGRLLDERHNPPWCYPPNHPFFGGTYSTDSIINHHKPSIFGYLYFRNIRNPPPNGAKKDRALTWPQHEVHWSSRSNGSDLRTPQGGGDSQVDGFCWMSISVNGERQWSSIGESRQFFCWLYESNRVLYGSKLSTSKFQNVGWFTILNMTRIRSPLDPRNKSIAICSMIVHYLPLSWWLYDMRPPLSYNRIDLFHDCCYYSYNSY